MGCFFLADKIDSIYPGAKFVHCADKLLRNIVELALTQLPNDEDVMIYAET